MDDVECESLKRNLMNPISSFQLKGSIHNYHLLDNMKIFDDNIFYKRKGLKLKRFNLKNKRKETITVTPKFSSIFSFDINQEYLAISYLKTDYYFSIFSYPKFENFLNIKTENEKI